MATVICAAEELIDQLDLLPIKNRLMKELNWTEEQADNAVLWYRRFLKLISLFPKAMLVPTQFIDEAWHAHILHTRLYHRMCDCVFGYYIHHTPSADEDHSAEFETTCQLFREHFGESPTETMFSKNGGCSSRSYGKCGDCASGCH